MKSEMKNGLRAALAAGLCMIAFSASAQGGGEVPTKGLGHALGFLCIFAAVGTVALIAGFKVFDKAITKIDFEEEILKGNVAAGLLAAAMVLGLSIIIAVSMM
jgi:hypothetical protein